MGVRGQCRAYLYMVINGEFAKCFSCGDVRSHSVLSHSQQAELKLKTMQRLDLIASICRWFDSGRMAEWVLWTDHNAP